MVKVTKLAEARKCHITKPAKNLLKILKESVLEKKTWRKIGNVTLKYKYTNTYRL